MTEIPDICIWTHRWSEWLPKCAESIARHTRGNYNLIVVCEPGSCHENMNRVLARSHSRYTVFLDEDVEILTSGWLDILLDDLRQQEDLGVVGCREVKDEFPRALYLRDAQRFLDSVKSAGLQEATWVPAYVMVFDRQRYPTLHFDEDIPGLKGMTDVDICLQLRKHGLKVARDMRVVVFHPHRRESERGRNGVPTKEQELEWFAKQRAYMTLKWEDDYAKDPTLNPQT